MGDRANIYLRQEQGEAGIYLYSHWGGHDMPVALRKALDRGRGRWNDESYLGRIIFNEITRGIEFEETGAGISTYPTDNERPLLVVDASKQRVEVHGFPYVPNASPRRSASFGEFCTFTDDQARAFRGDDE